VSEHRMRGPRRMAVGVAVVALSWSLAACTSTSAPRTVASLPGSAATSTPAGALGVPSGAESDQAMVDFTRCLRGHGVAEPDPVRVPGHAGLSVDVPPPTAKNRPALNACNHFISGLMSAKLAHGASQVASWLPALTRYAQCMRAHGIGMLDPNAEGSLNLGNVPGLPPIGRYTPQFRQADAACRHVLPRGVRDDGTGP